MAGIAVAAASPTTKPDIYLRALLTLISICFFRKKKIEFVFAIIIIYSMPLPVARALRDFVCGRRMSANVCVCHTIASHVCRRTNGSVCLMKSCPNVCIEWMIKYIKRHPRWERDECACALAFKTGSHIKLQFRFADKKKDKINLERTAEMHRCRLFLWSIRPKAMDGKCYNYILTYALRHRHRADNKNRKQQPNGGFCSVCIQSRCRDMPQASHSICWLTTWLL